MVKKLKFSPVLIFRARGVPVDAPEGKTLIIIDTVFQNGLKTIEKREI